VPRGIERRLPLVVEKGNTWTHLPVLRGMLRLQQVARLGSTPVRGTQVHLNLLPLQSLLQRSSPQYVVILFSPSFTDEYII